jgi:hypothetical protein
MSAIQIQTYNTVSFLQQKLDQCWIDESDYQDKKSLSREVREIIKALANISVAKPFVVELKEALKSTRTLFSRDHLARIILKTLEVLE